MPQEPIDALFQYAREQIASGLKMHRHDEQPPKMLYHYTTAAGLRGMLESKTIWATHVDFMNDWNDGRYGRALIAEYVDKHFSFEPEMRTNLFSMVAPDSHSWGKHLFVACFSTDPDVLSQWLAYGDNGRGYSLGVPLASIPSKHALHDEIGASFIAPVVYERSTQEALLDNALRPILRRISDGLASGHLDVGAVISAIAQPIHQLADFCSAFFKSDAFAAEQEWRLITLGKVDDRAKALLQFRDTTHGMAPYIPLPLAGPSLEIAEIWCGPRNIAAVAERTVVWLLGHPSCNIKRYDVKTSRASYRGS